jgi:hypothetical protein
MVDEHCYQHLDHLQLSSDQDIGLLCEREIDDTESDLCLICSRNMPISELHEHLAEHMEVIALSGLDEADEVELETKNKEVS